MTDLRYRTILPVLAWDSKYVSCAGKTEYAGKIEYGKEITNISSCYLALAVDIL